MLGLKVIPETYRALLRDRRAQRLLSGRGVSSLGDGMSTVTIAWLAVRTAPAGEVGLFVGLAVAAYTLPGAVGALPLADISAIALRALVLANGVRLSPVPMTICRTLAMRSPPREATTDSVPGCARLAFSPDERQEPLVVCGVGAVGVAGGVQ